MSVVILDTENAVAPETLSHECDPGSGVGERAKQAAHWISAVMTGHPQVARALLFEQDYSPQTRLTEGTRTRLRLEGAILGALSERVGVVAIKDGRSLGSLLGGSKAAAIAQGAALGLGADHDEAAAAALAVEHL